MDLIKIDKKLKRITTVYESFKEDGKISPLEKDLLLGYIRELYDHVSEIEVVPVVISQTMPKETAKEPTPVPVELPATQEVVKPMIEEVKEVPAEAMVVPSPVTENIPIVKKEIPAPVTEETEPVKHSATNSFIVPNDLKSIFTIVKARDISERLAMSPIADIAKAMSINDKMLILKELFGNNASVFNESITKLNSFTSFEEAKEYLIQHIALKYEWAQEERLEKAEAFVKLVSRRYS